MKRAAGGCVFLVHSASENTHFIRQAERTRALLWLPFTELLVWMFKWPHVSRSSANVVLAAYFGLAAIIAVVHAQKAVYILNASHREGRS